MRFKAKLVPEQVSLLYSLIVQLSRLGSSTTDTRQSSSIWLQNGSIVYLDTDHVRISCKGKTQDTEGISCFAELKAGGGIFLEHRIESAAKNNSILMELDLTQLKMALQSAVQDKHSTSKMFQQQTFDQRTTVLKLAKRNNMACLCMEAFSAGMVQIHHAIPVRILRPEDLPHYLPPQIAIPDVQLQIPTHKPLRTVIDNFRSMGGTTVLVQASRRTGDLTVTMESDGASIRTFFGKFVPLPDEANQNNPSDSNTQTRKDECIVKVDVRKLCAALQWQQASVSSSVSSSMVSSALLCLVENEQLVMHVTLDPPVVGFFTYYVPVHYMSTTDYGNE